MDHPDRDVYLGEVLAGRWEIRAFLGSGHFSNVYEARDLATSDGCAVKILAMAHHGHPAATVEFETECELLRLLESRSHVIRRFDHGRHPMTVVVGTSSVPLNVPFLVLEAAEGDLEELLLHRHTVEWEDKLKLFRDVAKGVHQMQLDRVVNRDLKSENILLVANGRDVTAKVSDMGRGRSLRTPVRFSPQAYEHGRGDRRFIAPELLWGLGSADDDLMRLGDLYLLGSIFFEIATAQGITAMAVGDPSPIIAATARLRPDQRQASFAAHTSDLQARYELAYELFERELPGPVRQVGTDLLRYSPR
jgi:serine/threonine protein kinase